MPNTDIVLIAVSRIDTGVRILYSILKREGYEVETLFNLSRDLNEKRLSAIINWIEKKEPILIGISSSLYTREDVINLSKLIKIKTDSKVVVGGPDPSLNPRLYIKDANYVIRGEGEKPFLRLVKSMIEEEPLENKTGICINDEGTIFISQSFDLFENLDKLSFPDYKDIDYYTINKGEIENKDYIKAFEVNRGTIFSKEEYPICISASRGCPFRCSYCTNSLFAELGNLTQFYRERNLETVIEEVKSLKKNYPKIDFVLFADNDFFLRKKEDIKKFSMMWRKKVGLPFFVYSNASSFDRDKFRLLLNCGLRYIGLGLETGSQKILSDIYNKKRDRGRVLEIAKEIKKEARKGDNDFFMPLYDLMFNNPYETERDISKTIDLLKKLPKPFFAHFQNLRFINGSKIFERAKEDGLVKRETKGDHADLASNILPKNMPLRGKNYLLNFILFSLHGYHTKNKYGSFPPFIINLLTNKKIIRILNHRKLVSLFYTFLPTSRKLSSILNFIENKLFSR